MKLSQKGEKLLKRLVSLLVLLVLNGVVSYAVSVAFHLNYWGVLLVLCYVPFIIAEYTATIAGW